MSGVCVVGADVKKHKSPTKLQRIRVKSKIGLQSDVVRKEDGLRARLDPQVQYVLQIIASA